MRRRTKSRDYALQLMYCAAITEADAESAKNDFKLEYPDEDEEIRNFAESLFDKAFAGRESDENTIKQFLNEKWTYERLGTVEQCILRLAITELFGRDVPAYAILGDYVTLAKNYGDDKSASFVNGILESIRVKFSIEWGDERKKN